MKFAVTATPISRKTRRRIGKSRVEVVDTEKNEFFAGVTDPKVIEIKFEDFWNNHLKSPTIVKVIDVRRLEDAIH